MSESSPDQSPLLSVRDLQVHFPIKGGVLQRTVDYVKAVDGVSFDVPRGKTVGLVGESGSGKTTTGRAIARLVPITAGTITYEGQDLAHLSRAAFFDYRKKIQVIFQDPFGSLNPRMTIYSIIAEPLDIHFKDWSKAQKTARVADLLEKVGLSADFMQRYPHQFSGGQRQRIGIARALAVEPEFIICDEPVSALDVSVQAQIVNLLQDLQEELGLTYLFIAHDLAVVEHISDEVLVMTEGKIVEQATADEIYNNPQHEYTKKLLNAVPSL
ncbi:MULTISPECIES: ABC transporter ATP-binding protein [unclassified Lentimonas]|uniref:ABC transporter ATP-binding protein n=1 Tax=unclassified Lentimonas TaxID=2630993 RepID=UPI00132AB615|nr:MULTISPECIES: ATP-binding cassette domain-containing protein [unclassified Lentimonas]CAA6678124.1 Oligopeptide transport ATP-binding protein OppF (TC 3.A.1.5.1) [Lentimonas sp. CC4]CAA6685987.1 Oligopeptide transport ATP-binding protein OppF (TC 3.A.1.5.1) [Lentimonas sp. CC6]CAA6691809.1 Oligopeptide transport ATP-binding protein OppF (TC 3.A.1.5.1) [Lentimonas sp. CC19]CAA6694557.1 Oligopeptide transport ATP-binding protein OppF (TC 3.A.1.5.1) [Lentimonas sp. CC10]CAA7072098.1 Oligopepti